MSADRLLLWMSARTNGSWQQFRAAVEQLPVPDDGNDADADGSEDGVDIGGLPLYQALRLNLQRVGHAEFWPGAHGIEWRVTPPSLAIVQRHDGVLGVLAGARSVRLLDKLSALAGSRLETWHQSNCPASLCIRASEIDELEDLANRSGLHVQKDAARALLTCLPPVDDPAVRRRADLPFGADWRVEQFDPRALRWQQSQRDAALSSRLGLFRFSLAYQHPVFLSDRGSFFRVPPQVGKFVVARRQHRRFIRHDSKRLALSVPAIYRPPFLIERALTLSSGRLAVYQRTPQEGGLLEYTEVSAEVARLAAGLLRQELFHE